MRRVAIELFSFVVLLFVSGDTTMQEPVNPGDRSKFVEDVTIPDGTKVKPGQALEKQWRVQNVGNVRWEGRFLTANSSSAGEADRKSIAPTPIPPTAPDELCLLTAKLTAPARKGTYRVEFKMTDAKGMVLLTNQQAVFILVVVE